VPRHIITQQDARNKKITFTSDRHFAQVVVVVVVVDHKVLEWQRNRSRGGRS
jgi:hypothetical protein